MFRAFRLLTRATNIKGQAFQTTRTLYSQSCNSLSSANHDAHGKVISAIREYVKTNSVLSNFVLVDALKSSYPDFHLSQTPESTGLKELSQSDVLQISLDTSIEWYGSREKSYSVDKIQTREDLRYTVEFGRYSCRWKDLNFYIYAADYWQSEWDRVSNHYILCSQEHAQVVNGRSGFADDLILASLQHNARVEEEIWLYDDGDWGRSAKLWKSVEDCTWDNIILNQDLKDELMKDVSSFFDRREYYKAFGVPWKRGLILHGLPGNGKTISIKAIMRTLDLRPKPIPTLYVKSLGSECRHRDIKSIFEKARETAPCLLVFEDLDSLVTENVRSFFLNEVDGLEQNDGILIVGSTNYRMPSSPNLQLFYTNFTNSGKARRRYFQASKSIRQKISLPTSCRLRASSIL